MKSISQKDFFLLFCCPISEWNRPPDPFLLDQKTFQIVWNTTIFFTFTLIYYINCINFVVFDIHGHIPWTLCSWMDCCWCWACCCRCACNCFHWRSCSASLVERSRLDSRSCSYRRQHNKICTFHSACGSLHPERKKKCMKIPSRMSVIKYIKFC